MEKRGIRFIKGSHPFLQINVHVCSSFWVLDEDFEYKELETHSSWQNITELSTTRMRIIYIYIWCRNVHTISRQNTAEKPIIYIIAREDKQI